MNSLSNFGAYYVNISTIKEVNRHCQLLYVRKYGVLHVSTTLTERKRVWLCISKRKCFLNRTNVVNKKEKEPRVIFPGVKLQIFM